MTVSVKLEVTNPPPVCSERRGNLELAVSTELTHALGTHSMKWLGDRSQNFARWYVDEDFPPRSRSRRLLDGEYCHFSLDPRRRLQPEPSSIPVVPAPNETTIAECIKKAAKSAHYWDALVTTAAMLRKNRQPFGDALSGWLVKAADRNAKRPKGSTAAKWTKNARRDFTICEVIQALEGCGMRAVTSDREPGPACDVCAEVFGSATKRLTAKTVLNIWKKRNHPLVM